MKFLKQYQKNNDDIPLDEITVDDFLNGTIIDN
jgi:hypothetical protein